MNLINKFSIKESGKYVGKMNMADISAQSIDIFSCKRKLTEEQEANKEDPIKEPILLIGTRSGEILEA